MNTDKSKRICDLEREGIHVIEIREEFLRQLEKMGPLIYSSKKIKESNDLSGLIELIIINKTHEYSNLYRVFPENSELSKHTLELLREIDNLTKIHIEKYGDDK